MKSPTRSFVDVDTTPGADSWAAPEVGVDSPAGYKDWMSAQLRIQSSGMSQYLYLFRRSIIRARMGLLHDDRQVSITGPYADALSDLAGPGYNSLIADLNKDGKLEERAQAINAAQRDKGVATNPARGRKAKQRTDPLPHQQESETAPDQKTITPTQPSPERAAFLEKYKNTVKL